MGAVSPKGSFVVASVLSVLIGCSSGSATSADGGQEGAPSSDGGGAGTDLGDGADETSASDACRAPLITFTCKGKCGIVTDVCGVIRNCDLVNGSCQAPATCGGGGVPNVCGCVSDGGNPCAGKNCGIASDGCGNPVVCGPPTCADGGARATCGGGGVPNVCGCTPLSQTTACSGKTCGVVDDGCGGTFSCGTCDTGLGLVCCQCVGGSWGCTTDIGGCMACGG